MSQILHIHLIGFRQKFQLWTRRTVFLPSEGSSREFISTANPFSNRLSRVLPEVIYGVQ